MAARIMGELRLMEEHARCSPRECERAWDRLGHCVHGTYVGWWGGPDYLCGACEDGASHAEYALRMAWARQAAHRRAFGKAAVDAVVEQFGGKEAEWLTEAEVAQVKGLVKALADMSV